MVSGVDVVAGVVQFAFKLDDERQFGPALRASLVSGLYMTRTFALHVTVGLEKRPTGLYVYFACSTPSDVALIVPGDRFFLNISANRGHIFNAGDPSTGHQLKPCSDRGRCNPATGQCECLGGFSGDACERSLCPNECSGRGTCQSQRYFVEDAVRDTPIASSVTYVRAFDAETAFGCKCDSGFRGPDCSLRECPSGPDPVGGDGGEEGLDCSGRGRCDFTTGLCLCFHGFYGERCETATTLI
jgi:hypothetical protein